MMMQNTIKKYLPSQIGVFVPGQGYISNAQVKSMTAHPPHKHPHNSGLIPECWCVEIVTSHGRRYRGFQNAYIDSSLRMVCELFPGQEKDEVLMSWEDVI